MLKKQKIEVPMATLDFYTYKDGDLRVYEFDATQLHPPEPMVNTFYGLNLLKEKRDILIGRYIQEPITLFNKIGKNYHFEVKELQNGDVEVKFSKI
jgi:hypothetical protein